MYTHAYDYCGYLCKFNKTRHILVTIAVANEIAVLIKLILDTPRIATLYCTLPRVASSSSKVPIIRYARRCYQF